MSFSDKNILIRMVVLILADIVLFWYAFSGTSLYFSRNYLPLHLFLMLLVFISGGLTLKTLGNFVQGFIGEADVKVVLSKLPSEFHRIYDINLVNRGNTDAVVVGPTGIWSIEVKSHKGRITVENETLKINGFFPEKNFLNQAYSEAKTLEDFIESKTSERVPVRPILVFSNRRARMKFGMIPQKGVYVIGIAWLNKLITENKKNLLSQQQIKKLTTLIKIT